MRLIHMTHWSYWFTQPLIARGGAAIALWAVMGALLALGIAGHVVYIYHPDASLKRVWKEIRLAGLAGGLYGLLWVFVRQERVIFWSWRFWLVPLAAFIVWRAVVAVRFYLQRRPEIKRQQMERAVREQYLPKPR